MNSRDGRNRDSRSRNSKPSNRTGKPSSARNRDDERGAKRRDESSNSDRPSRPPYKGGDRDKKFDKPYSGAKRTPYKGKNDDRNASGDERERKPYQGNRDDKSGRPSKSFKAYRSDDRNDRSERPNKPFNKSGDRDNRSERPSRPPYKSGDREQKSDRPYAGAKRSFDKGGKSDKPYSNKPRGKKPTPKAETLRLNKFIAHAGIASRREADDFIKAGLVEVNGKIITEMGYQVQTTDEVKYAGSIIKSETKRYLVMNKPKGFITTMQDDRGRKTVMNLISEACKERIYPVGRLDRNTTGVLMFTNDGDLAKKLTHPSHRVRKIYRVTLDKKLTKADLDKIAAGVKLEGKIAVVDAISYIENEPKNEVGIELHLGWNRVVRRIFESVGYEVVKLDRVLFGELTKKNLPRGRWRFLTEGEVNILKQH